MKNVLKFAISLALLLTAPLLARAALDASPIVIGLDADMSSGSARSGEAIRRGATLAIAKINRAGGVLGRRLELIVRDHRGNPARGIDNIESFAATENLVAVIGGLHTPVAMAELETIHRNKIVYLGPWAAGTPVVDNGYVPNYVFRVSVRDEHAGGFLVRYAVAEGYRRIGLLLENTGWGRSNQHAMTAALAEQGLDPVIVEWFLWGAKDLKRSIDAIRDAGADAIMLVANAPEGQAFLREMAERPEGERLPVVSHWGITGGRFFESVRDILPQVDLTFLQTFSFVNPPYPERAARVADAYHAAYPGGTSVRDIVAPVGTAHAYDLVHLLAQAIRAAGSTRRDAIRDALESLDRYEGLVRDYDLPFTAQRHDALTVDDYRMARYDDDGAIILIDEQ